MMIEVCTLEFTLKANRWIGAWREGTFLYLFSRTVISRNRWKG